MKKWSKGRKGDMPVVWESECSIFTLPIIHVFTPTFLHKARVKLEAMAMENLGYGRRGTRCIIEPLWRLGLFLYQPNLAVAPRSHKFRAVSITEIAFVGTQPFSIWLEAILLVVSVSEDPGIRNTTEAWGILSWGASTSKTWKWQGDGGGVSGL